MLPPFLLDTTPLVIATTAFAVPVHLRAGPPFLTGGISRAGLHERSPVRSGRGMGVQGTFIIFQPSVRIRAHDHHAARWPAARHIHRSEYVGRRQWHRFPHPTEPAGCPAAARKVGPC